jgi:hypothetical protein
MMKKLTVSEDLIRKSLSTVKEYPRWKYVYFTKGFLYYLTPDHWVQEVFKHRDGTWSVDGSNFSRLEDALRYGKQLAMVQKRKDWKPDHEDIALM